MKRYLALLFVLAIVWLVWSGHFDPFLLTMGGLSCLVVLIVAGRMGIIDDEGVPIQLGLRPQIKYAPWLAREVMRSNWSMVKVILSRRPRFRRNLIQIPITLKTEIGRVIMANSITLTPGTVSTRFQGDQLEVHALMDPGPDDPTIVEIEKRVRDLEGN
jgi:multicomponent Na+:H+ antiporter subunit E